jgi:hypothetical protein
MKFIRNEMVQTTFHQLPVCAADKPAIRRQAVTEIGDQQGPTNMFHREQGEDLDALQVSGSNAVGDSAQQCRRLPRSHAMHDRALMGNILNGLCRRS